MCAFVDLTTDGESPSGQSLGRTAAQTPINLLSSDEETPLKKQKVSVPHSGALPTLGALPDLQRLPQHEPDLDLDLDLGQRLRNSIQAAQEPLPQPATSRQGRARRALKKAYGEDFDYDLDFGGSQSQAATQPSSLREQAGDECVPTQASVDAASPDSAKSFGRGSKASQKGRGRLSEEEKAAREAEKERKKQERIAAREEKKRQKEAEKAEKQAQRAQQKLDRRRETGKTALPDMTVHLDPDFAKHRAGREVMQALEDTFGEPGVEGPGVDIGQRLAMWPLKCATWSRAAFKAGEGSQPASQAEAERQTVDYMLLYFTAEEFVGKVSEDRLQSVIQQAALKCPECTLCLMVDGLEHYLTLRQRREFQANGPGGGGFNRAWVDEFLGGMATAWPGVRHIVVNDTAQAAEHFAGLTRALAEQPFRAEVAYVNSFGAGKPDSAAMLELLRQAPLPHKDREVWFKALSFIPKLGPQAAHAVSSHYPSLGSLIATYQSHPGNLREKEGLLQDMTQFGGRRVGPVGSTSVFQILTSDDPNLCL